MKTASLLIWCAWLTGCASWPSSSCVDLAPQASYCLQPSQAVAPFAVQQHIDIQSPHRQDTAIASLQVDAHVFAMAVLSPMGQKLMQFEYAHPAFITLDNPAPQMDARWIAALIQLSVWPSDRVTQGLHGNVQWTASANARKLQVGNDTLIEIAIQGRLPRPQKLHIKLPQQQIELRIRNLKP